MHDKTHQEAKVRFGIVRNWDVAGKFQFDLYQKILNLPVVSRNKYKNFRFDVFISIFLGKSSSPKPGKKKKISTVFYWIIVNYAL